jgi:hypothetical protein
MSKLPNRTILNLKPKSEYVEGLRRYCRFFDMTMTGFLERKIRLYERNLKNQLTPEQWQQYLDGELTFEDLSEAELAAFNSPATPHVAAG